MKAQTRLSAVKFALLSTIKQALVCERRRVPSTFIVIHGRLKPAHAAKKKKITYVYQISVSNSQGTVASTLELHFGEPLRHLAGRG